MREWFKARNVWGAVLSALPDEEAGRLAKAIWTYTMSGEITELDGASKGIFAMILMILQQDKEHDDDISRKRSEATAGIRKQKKSDDKSDDQCDSSDIDCNQLQSNDINSNQMISNDINCSNKNKNKSKSKNKNKETESDNVVPLKRFVPPTVDEVALYCVERHNHVNAEKFVDYYTSNGWRVGKNPMKDWKATVRTWERSDLTEKDYQHEREFSGLPY